MESLSKEITGDPILKNYEKCFKGIGCLGTIHKIQLKEGAKPRIVATRRIPVALRDKVKTELDKLEEMGIIEKVNQPTEWINRLVTVQKPN
ncbi:uncharacterized protein B4U80_00378, partial [Leptotrombidium deliense]